MEWKKSVYAVWALLPEHWTLELFVSAALTVPLYISTILTLNFALFLHEGKVQPKEQIIAFFIFLKLRAEKIVLYVWGNQSMTVLL